MFIEQTFNHKFFVCGLQNETLFKQNRILFSTRLDSNKREKAYRLIPGYRAYEYEVWNNSIARVHNYTMSMGFIRCSKGVFEGIRIGVGELHTA